MQITLSYFDIAVSRGEECRLALFHAGLPFTDDRVKDWAARKPETPFGALPVLTVEGHGTFAQTNAILGLIGRLHGLHPSDPWEAARHEMLMGAVEDLRGHMSPIGRIQDPAEKQRAREEAARGYLPTWGTQVERQLAARSDGPFVGGATLQVVDLKLFVALGPYRKGAIDHVPPSVFDHCPRLLAVADAVARHPKTVEWYARTR